jgi:hypothetical protein
MTGTLIAGVRRAGRPRRTGGSYVCGARLQSTSGDGPWTFAPSPYGSHRKSRVAERVDGKFKLIRAVR